MKSDTLLMLMLALGSGRGGLDMTTLLTATDMLPAMPRMILAIVGAQQRDDKANTLARQLSEAMQANAAKVQQADVDSRSELKALLDRLDATERGKIIVAPST